MLTKTKRSSPEVPHHLNLNRTLLPDDPRRAGKKKSSQIGQKVPPLSHEAPVAQVPWRQPGRSASFTIYRASFLVFFGPWMIPLWRGGSGTSDPAQVCSTAAREERRGRGLPARNTAALRASASLGERRGATGQRPSQKPLRSCSWSPASWSTPSAEHKPAFNLV